MAARKRTAKQQVNDEWESRFVVKLAPIHPRSTLVKAKKLIKRINGVLRSMKIRSEKYNVECNVTLDELMQLALDAYGTECKYSKRQLVVTNMVFDHKIPISKGGSSNVENLQVISKFSNGVKGSLSEEDFLTLMAWLDTVPFGKDIAVRLAGGIR